MKNTSHNRTGLSSRPRVVPLACSLIAVLAMAVAFVTTESRADFVSLFVPLSEPSVTQGGATGTIYLRGSGGQATNPTTLYLDASAPTSSTAKSKDSASISMSGGNPWKEIGTWSATLPTMSAQLASLSDVHVWLGLKNSDDQGTNFDLRVEAYKNSTLVASGQKLCVTGVTRNPASAKEVVLTFNPFSPVTFNGPGDVPKLKILTRVGTNGSGGSCGGHSNAVGLRLYFDAVNRASRFTATVASAADTTPPTITIQQPANNTITSASQISVSGTFSDQSPTTITVNGIAATLNGNNFLAQVPLTEGPNTLLIVATDSFGNHTDVTRTVTRDTSPPTLSVQQPADFTYTSAASIQITGTFTGATSITVNGASPTINGNQFSANVSLTVEGVNTIEVKAVDAAGNQSDLFLTINRDTTAPAISLTSPQEGAFAKTLATQGSVTDASPVNVTVDGVQVTVEDGLFQSDNEVAEGSRQVTVVATDAAGNHSQVVRSLTIDRTSPVFSNISPAEGSGTNSPATISGHVTDISPVAVKVSEINASVNANGDFTAIVPLVDGQNSLLLTAVDAAGNENDDSLTLIGPDRAAPSAPEIFAVNSPTRLTRTVLSGRAESGASIVISGGSETITTQAAFGSGLFAANVNLNLGSNSLSVVAADAAGNTGPAAQVSIVSDPNMALPPAGQPSQINISTGNGQKGLVNTPLPRPLIVIVTDQTGTPVTNTTVKFTVQEGGGRFALNSGPTIEVDTDAQGYARASYISGPGVGLQQIRADFTGNTLPPATFLAQSLQSSGGETTVSGVVLDQNLRALPNVLVRISGQQTRTGANGRFTVTNVPSGPHQLLELIGRDQIQLPGRWPNISFDLDVLPGVDNTVARPFFLPRVNAGINLPLDANNVVTQDTTYELAVVGTEPPVRVTAKAGTRVIFPPDVTDKRLSVTRIPTNRIPMTLEDGRATNLYISVQPSGAVFETPLEVSFPNLDGLPPNSPILLMSFDHDAGRYVQVGTGHVSADGRSVTSDPGSGIRVGAWHGGPPAPPRPEATILGLIQIAGNPAFLDKEIVHAEAWADGGTGVITPDPNVGPIGDAPSLSVMVTIPLAAGAAISTRIESIVIAEKKLKIKFDSFDKRFAPSVERLNFKYTVTAGEGDPPTVGKFEVFKSGDTSNPIFVDTTLPPTANKLDYSQDGTSGWDGKMNQGADSGKYIEPKDGPFTLRITVATEADFSDEVKDEKTVNVEIASMDLTPDNDYKSFKPTLNATEVDSPIELTMKIKNKAGQGVVTSIPFKIQWEFEDPDDSAGNSIVDPNGSGVDDNAEVQFGGKKANAGSPASAGVMWKTVSGFVATVSQDGQSVEAELSTTGADQGKSKLTFSTSVIGGDNYFLFARYLRDDGTTVVKEKKSGRWSVWKRFEFQNAYRMNGGSDVGGWASRGNVIGAYNGEGYTEYTRAIVNSIPPGNNSPEYVADLIQPLPDELPAPNDTQAQINTKAQRWFNRNNDSLGPALVALAASIGAPNHSLIGARYYHPKLDGRPGTGQTNFYPSATRIDGSNNGTLPTQVDPDGEWRNVQGVATASDIAFIFLNITDPQRNVIVARHETGHASDHKDFGIGDGGNGDHASSGLMHPTSDQVGRPPLGDPEFSPISIRRLRGLRN